MDHEPNFVEVAEPAPRVSGGYYSGDPAVLAGTHIRYTGARSDGTTYTHYIVSPFSDFGEYNTVEKIADRERAKAKAHLKAHVMMTRARLGLPITDTVHPLFDPLY
jgi:hypothetical protein